ncbi:heavy-metal-associated domain-containing protein [Nocardia violaceofusca]|uniref:heavy-metal-associated domain-containing protein n=1 Tax=Nocardia violaceofusca TaxID=941182 RepID=UPI0009FEF5FF|nr:heavy-metal-associated domain-containing protein [Nocardia violaceofusca]
MNETVYSVAGMTCGHCAGAVSRALTSLDGVEAVDVDAYAGRGLVPRGHDHEDRCPAACMAAGHRRIADEVSAYRSRTAHRPRSTPAHPRRSCRPQRPSPPAQRP